MPTLHPTWGLWYWPNYLIGVGGAFLVAEVYAFFTNVWNTLSYYAWYEMGITGRLSPHHPAWWISFIAWLVFVVAITAHIWFVVHFRV